MVARFFFVINDGCLFMSSHQLVAVSVVVSLALVACDTASLDEPKIEEPRIVANASTKYNPKSFSSNVLFRFHVQSLRFAPLHQHSPKNRISILVHWEQAYLVVSTSLRFFHPSMGFYAQRRIVNNLVLKLLQSFVCITISLLIHL